MEFKVVKINHEYKNVVVSHKALIEDELELRKPRSSRNLKKDKSLKELLKILLPMVYSLILAVLTDLFTLPTSAGDVSIIRKRL